MIYFIAKPDRSLVKIGTTIRLSQRLKQLAAKRESVGWGLLLKILKDYRVEGGPPPPRKAKATPKIEYWKAPPRPAKTAQDEEKERIMKEIYAANAAKARREARGSTPGVAKMGRVQDRMANLTEGQRAFLDGLDTGRRERFDRLDSSRQAFILLGFRHGPNSIAVSEAERILVGTALVFRSPWEMDCDPGQPDLEVSWRSVK